MSTTAVNRAVASWRPSSGHVAVLSIALAALCLLLPSRAEAWHRFDGGCGTCHPFNADPYQPPGGGPAWPASLHDVHRDAAFMNADCDLCHRPEDEGNPWLTWSVGVGAAPPVGCMGCHGRMTGAQPSTSGLLSFHDLQGAGCSQCHDAFTYPPAAPESYPPPYYGLGVSNVDSPCNGDASTLEDWSGDGLGLDNDGDGVLDLADPDCSAPVCGDGIVQAGELCDGTNLWDNDCTTVDETFGSGTLACLPDCSGWDLSACVAAGSCGNGVVDDGELCDGADLDGQDCASIGEGFADGTLACTPGCDGWDTAGCTNREGCGNGVLDPGETCDPPSSCPTWCGDDDLCTADVLQGDPLSCDAECVITPITACADSDGCCPDGCTQAEDTDCPPPAEDDGCGCRSGGPGPGPATGLGLLVLLGLLLRRRRRN